MITTLTLVSAGIQIVQIKIPSEIEVALSCRLVTMLDVFTLCTLPTLLTLFTLSHVDGEVEGILLVEIC